MTTWTRHPAIARFREDPPDLRLSYTTTEHAADLGALVNYCREQQRQIVELQWCVSALLDVLESRGMLRLSSGQPTRDRHGERP